MDYSSGSRIRHPSKMIFASLDCHQKEKRDRGTQIDASRRSPYNDDEPFGVREHCMSKLISAETCLHSCNPGDATFTCIAIHENRQFPYWKDTSSIKSLISYDQWLNHHYPRLRQSSSATLESSCPYREHADALGWVQGQWSHPETHGVGYPKRRHASKHVLSPNVLSAHYWSGWDLGHWHRFRGCSYRAQIHCLSSAETLESCPCRSSGCG
jgi:hypothetical protein